MTSIGTNGAKPALVRVSLKEVKEENEIKKELEEVNKKELANEVISNITDCLGVNIKRDAFRRLFFYGSMEVSTAASCSAVRTFFKADIASEN